MSMSKHKLAGSLSKKTLTIEEKIKLLDDYNKKRQSCRQLADQFSIGKTAAAKIVKNETSIRQEYERFKGNLKRNRKGQFHKINEILYEWFKKCCEANIYPDGQMLKEEALEIKKHLDNDEFSTFTASNGWLEKWKISYGIREKRVNGEAGEVRGETVNAWMERLWELTKDYSPADIWNMDETGCFFKALPEKGLAEKKSQARGGKKSKTRLTIAFFVSAAGEKVIEPIVIWRSAKPSCFKKLPNPKRPYDVHYYSSPKAWMTSEIMESVLTKINRKMEAANRNILLLMDNAPCHPESFVDSYSNIKIVFLPKNTTSRLQPLDAGIIRNFKVKYRKRLLKFVISRIDDNRKASDIIKEVDVLKAISWIKASWEEVSDQTVINCFHKCGFRNQPRDEDVQTLDQDIDREFADLVKELAGDVDPNDYVDFDREVVSSMPAVDTGNLGWRQELRKEIIEKHENPNPEFMDVSSDEDQNEENEDPENIKSASEALQVMDKVVRFSLQLGNENLRDSLMKVVESLEDLKISTSRQTKITTFFTKK